MSSDTTAIEALLDEKRSFAPPAEFARQANAQAEIYDRADRDYVEYWASWARKLDWMKPFSTALEWKEPFARWFADGELNVSVNCLDRHVRAGKGDKIAFYFEGEPGDRLRREDNLYDFVIEISHNARPRIARRGSAVFIHVARPGLKPTAGCVALSLPRLRQLLERVGPRTLISIR